MRLALPSPLLLSLALVSDAQTRGKNLPGAAAVPGKFVDVTAARDIQFHHAACRTSMKYELEMIGSGAALFDYENEERKNLPVAGNRDGIGAVVEVTTGAGKRYSTCTTAGSYLSSGDKRLHFGLGGGAMVSQVEVRWPSGIVPTLKNVRGDQMLAVEEPGSGRDRRP